MGVRELLKILLVEDDPSTVEMLKILLDLEGYEVVTTSHAKEVLTLLEKERPDILLMDFHLGQDDGIGVLRAIRRNPKVADTPIVVVSGMECSWEAEKAGADIFLLKPFGIDELLETLRKAMAQCRKSTGA